VLPGVAKGLFFPELLTGVSNIAIFEAALINAFMLPVGFVAAILDAEFFGV